MDVKKFCQGILLSLLCFFIIGCASNKFANCTTSSCRDTNITTEVQIKIAADTCLNDQGIDVSTFEGVVTLNGTVENPTQRNNAIFYARSVPGVKGVRSRLTLKRDHRRY